MHASVDYEKGRQNLDLLLNSPLADPQSRNEATTRLHLIDYLFLECLGWNREDVETEAPHGKEFADYSFSAPHRVLIVEAKKEGDYFELPAGSKKLEYSIPSLFRDYRNVEAALTQAAGYCWSRGVPFGAVCNGHQLIAFVASRSDGVAPLRGKALVLDSLCSMLENFKDLWQALSRPAIQRRLLYARLVGDMVTDLPSKLSASIPAYPGIIARNVLQTDLQIVAELVLEDIARSPQLESTFLREAYSQSGALSQHAMVSKEILQTRYAALFNADVPGPTVVPATTKKGISPELYAESLSRRPILLLGDVGVGKTSFIRHLIKIDAAPQFERAITLYIDLGTQAALAQDVRAFISDEIVRQLNEDHGVNVYERNFVYGTYHSEIHNFSKGIHGDLKESNPNLFREKEISFIESKISQTDQHLRASLIHLSKLRNRQVVIFIDNSDQRNYETQQLAFLISQEMAQSWPAVVYVSLRPETFHRSIRSGALSAYHPKAFTISPPRIDDVVQKRLQFGLKITNGEIPLETISNVSIKLSSLDRFMRIFLNSLQKNRDLVEFLDNMSVGNVRQALDLVKSFFGSGHVDTEKIIKVPGYIIPVHEFMRAVIYGDGTYYDPHRSPVRNVFDLAFVDSREHFLMPLMITSLHNLSGASAPSGYVDSNKLMNRLQSFGFQPDQIDSILKRAISGKLIENAPGASDDHGQVGELMLRPTTAGVYHVSRFCARFVYIDAVVVDTPILNREVRNSIRNVHLIENRLERAELFRRYLDDQWSHLRISDPSWDWSVFSKQLAGEIGRISMTRR